MDYEQALEWVHSLPRLAAHPGVENTRRLLEKLGNPEKSLRFVHVAGTNGKGSATVMLASVLHRAGYRVGASVSPYVLEFRERFLLDGEMISRETLAQILTEVRAAAEGLRAEGWDSLVEFDAVTAATLLWFARERCDIVCLEVGLGGRLDSTNAVENTLVACIMCIGRDHTELLGDTYAAIAGEKCGILKNNCTVISYPAQPQEAMDEITLRAAKAHCPLVAPDLQDLHIYKAPAFENRVNYGGYDLVVPFPGVHQAYNAAVVVEAALALCEKGFDISDEAILDGIAGARFPARIEVLSRRPLVVLDGAHNPDGARALAATLRGAGLSAFVGKLGMDRNSPDSYREPSAAAGLAETRRWLDTCRAENTLHAGPVRPMITPRFTPSTSDEYMRGLGELAKEYSVPAQSHRVGRRAVPRHKILRRELQPVRPVRRRRAHCHGALHLQPR